MDGLRSPFRTVRGEREYLAAYDATMRLWPVPYESMDFRSRFGITHVVACGPEKSPPLMLLHCFFTSLTIWARNVAALSEAHRVYALDMMGQPSRSIPDEPIRNRHEMAEWLNSVVDALGLRRLDLVGYSYGGFAALNYAIQSPDLVRRLILLCPAGGLVPLRRQFYLRGMATMVPGFRRPAMRSFLEWMFYEPNLALEGVRALSDSALEQMTLGAKHFQLGMMVPPSVIPDDELRGVAAPTLLLVGDREPLYDPRAAIERAGRIIPKIDTRLIPEAAHELPLGLSEVVNQQILEFLGSRDPRLAGDVFTRRIRGTAAAKGS
jgi:pimeloyl-ACP methyl ester carboxylesterase